MSRVKWAKHFDPIKSIPPPEQITEFLLDGGRIGGKSHHVAAEIVECVSTMPNFNAVCCRANATDLRGSVRSIVVKKIVENGLLWRFKIPDGDLTITDIYNGNKIYFRAYEKSITRTKGDEPQGNVGIVWVEESNEARDYLKLDAMITTYLRHMKNGGRIFYTYNPMPNPQHWSHDYYAKKLLGRSVERLWCNWRHIAKFLPKATLRKIIDAKNTNDKYYRFWYQGEVVSFEGLIFPQWDRQRHYVPSSFFKQEVSNGNIQKFSISRSSNTELVMHRVQLKCVSPHAILRM